VRLALGEAYVHMGRYDEALQILKRAQELGCTEPALYYCYGVCLHETNRYNEAQAQLSYAYKSGIDNLDCIRRLAAIETRLGRYDEAARLFSAAIKARPDDTDLRYMLGICYHKLELTDLAMEQYRLIAPVDAKTADRLFKLIES